MASVPNMLNRRWQCSRHAMAEGVARSLDRAAQAAHPPQISDACGKW